MRADEHDANEVWFRNLRDRFVTVAARRVESDAVEDLVQDALRIVHEKAGVGPGTLVDGRPALAWCFQVLRNVVGNHYRRERTRRRFVVPDPDGQVDAAADEVGALDALESEDAVRLLRAGVASLGSPCAGYLEALMEGATHADIAAGEELEAAVFYRRLYRCRQKLREWLRAKGIHA